MQVIHHRNMLTDKVRMSLYAEAIPAVVKSGDAVLDIGTGSGVLALLSIRAGASKVYAVEAFVESLQA